MTPLHLQLKGAWPEKGGAAKLRDKKQPVGYISVSVVWTMGRSHQFKIES